MQRALCYFPSPFLKTSEIKRVSILVLICVGGVGGDKYTHSCVGYFLKAASLYTFNLSSYSLDTLMANSLELQDIGQISVRDLVNFQIFWLNSFK